MFLADENFPRAVVDGLREAGCDVEWIIEMQPGASDTEVLMLCMAGSRTLLTFDKDVGELAFKQRLSATCGIVVFRLAGISPEEMVQISVSTIVGHSLWTGHFSVIKRNGVRIRPLP